MMRQERFDNFIVQKPLVGRNIEKIYIGYKIIDVKPENYSSDYINEYFPEKKKLMSGTRNIFKYDVLLPEYRKHPELINHNPNKKPVFIDIENIGGISKSEDESKEISCVSCIYGYSKHIFINKNCIKITPDSPGVKEFICDSMDKLDDKTIKHIIFEKYNFQAHIFENEEDMMKDLYKKLIIGSEENNALITGWNVAYDIQNIIWRYEKYHGIMNVLCPVIDYIAIYRHYYKDKEDSFKLDYILNKELGKGKVKFSGSLDELMREDPLKYIEYNTRDVVGLVELEEKHKLFDLASFIVDFTGCLWTDICFNTKIWTALIFNYLKIHGRCMKELPYDNDDEYEGAMVFPPTPGFFQNVFCFDFWSLYPNIIIKWNLSLETYVPQSQVKNIDQKYLYKTPNNTYFYKPEIKKGISPTLMEFMLEIREDLKAEKKDIPQKGIKILANSHYGWYALVKKIIAETITACARDIIKYIMNFSNQYGLRGIYGDTDSVFIQATPEFINDCKDKGISISDGIQLVLDTGVERYIEKNGLSKDNKRLILEDEYGAVDGVWFRKPGTSKKIPWSDEGLKKKYILRMTDPEKIKNNKGKNIIVKGFYRSDNVRYGNVLFREMIDIFFKDRKEFYDTLNEIEEIIENNFEWNNPDWLIPYRLNKSLDDYKINRRENIGFEIFKKIFPELDIMEMGWERGVIIEFTIKPSEKRRRKREELCICVPEDMYDNINEVYIRLREYYQDEDIRLNIDKHKKRLLKNLNYFRGIEEIVLGGNK